MPAICKRNTGENKTLLLGYYPSWPKAVLHHLLSVMWSHGANACHVQQANKGLGKVNISQVIFLISSKLSNNLQTSASVNIRKSQIWKGSYPQNSILSPRAERAETLARRDGGEKTQSDTEIQRKMAMATRSPVEIYLIYSIPIHLAMWDWVCILITSWDSQNIL